MQASASSAAPPGRLLLTMALLVAANLMWGSSWVVAKELFATLTPLQVAAWRMIGAGLPLTPLAVWMARRGLLPPRDWPLLLLLALIGFVLPKALNLWGVSLSTAASASLLMSIEPLFTLLLGVLILRERVTRTKLAALLLGGAGTWLIIARGWGWPDLRSLGALGDLVFVAGLLTEAGYSVLGKRMLARGSPLTLTTATIVASLVFWLPIAAWDLALHGPPPVTPGTIAALAYLSVALTIVGYWIWFYALEHVDAGRVGLTIFVQPLAGTLLSIGWLGENLTPAMGLGGALVLAALALALRPERGGR